MTRLSDVSNPMDVRPTLPTEDLFDGLLQSEVRSLARVITLVENRSPEGMNLLRRAFAYSGRSRVIGITGSPGAGKSSLVDRLAANYRKLNKNIGIIAVDPSSSFSGGAILGDRIRMNALATDPGVFIRSMATRGNLGGLANATADVVSLLDAASRDPILVETVGVGQDEIDIVKLADISIVVLVPGMGDDVQALKAGIMEIGDIFVINKSDRPGVEKMERAIQALLSLDHRPDGWVPPILKTIATEDQGIDELAEAIDRGYEHFKNSPQNENKKRDAARERLMNLLKEGLAQKAVDTVFPGASLDSVIEEIVRREKEPHTIADEIILNARF
jgi:LAO/AO transport system kinase